MHMPEYRKTIEGDEVCQSFLHRTYERKKSDMNIPIHVLFAMKDCGAEQGIMYPEPQPNKTAVFLFSVFHYASAVVVWVGGLKSR